MASLSLCLLLVTGCNAMKPEDFADRQPRLVVEEYFAGETRGYGIFEDRFGKLRREFVVDMNGAWDGHELVLDERFRYSDGEADRRVWRITKQGDHRYEGRADDVVGTATGAAFGNALNWRYEMNLKAGDRTWRVSFNDWMFLQEDRVLINRARVYKWGVQIGEVTLFFRKPEAEMHRTGDGGWPVENFASSATRATMLRSAS
jgi:hypothetical protein